MNEFLYHPHADGDAHETWLRQHRISGALAMPTRRSITPDRRTLALSLRPTAAGLIATMQVRVTSRFFNERES